MKSFISIIVICALLIFAPVVSAASLEGSDDAVKAPVLPPGTESIKAQSEKSVVQAPVAGEIKPLADGKTIADIFVESDQLKDQVVSLNAKVIKVNKAIMGKNWITLQDGTGMKPEDKLVATSKAVVAPGDIVIVKGTVKTDVDLGRGYSYKVLLEDATFSPGLK